GSRGRIGNNGPRIGNGQRAGESIGPIPVRKSRGCVQASGNHGVSRVQLTSQSNHRTVIGGASSKVGNGRNVDGDGNGSGSGWDGRGGSNGGRFQLHAIGDHLVVLRVIAEAEGARGLGCR